MPLGHAVDGKKGTRGEELLISEQGQGEKPTSLKAAVADLIGEQVTVGVQEGDSISWSAQVAGELSTNNDGAVWQW